MSLTLWAIQRGHDGKRRTPKSQGYSPELRLRAVRLSRLSGVRVRDMADALDIHPFMLPRRRSV